MQTGNVRPDITKGISWIERKLARIENVPHEDNEASRDIEKSLAHINDVLVHVDPASRTLCENPFELPFSQADMHWEKKDVISFPPDMLEEKTDVASSLPEAHPRAIVNTFSAFALKQRTLVLKQRVFVLKQRAFVPKSRTCMHRKQASRMG